MLKKKIKLSKKAKFSLLWLAEGHSLWGENWELLQADMEIACTNRGLRTLRAGLPLGVRG